MTDARPDGGTPVDRRHGSLDRGLYALFSRHAEDGGHAADRDAYRGTDLRMEFDAYLVRVYACSWVAAAAVALGVLAVGFAVSPETLGTLGGLLHRALPGEWPALARVSRPVAVGAAALLAGAASKRTVVWLGGRHVRWRARARRAAIDRTLPGAVRYLRALSTGSDDRRTMLRKVAANEEAYGETAVAMRRVLNRAALVGSLDEALRIGARDTPSRTTLAPFLLKFREHAQQGDDALESYLRMEGRMLSHRQDRDRTKAQGFLELLSELFVVLLVLPALFVIVVTVMSVLAPGLNESVATPIGPVPVRTLLVAGNVAFILTVGAGTAWLVGALRPAAQSAAHHGLPDSLWETVTTVAHNPASTAVVCLPLAAGVATLCWRLGESPANVILLGYAAFALPVGLVAARRARLDDAKDRELKDFVHAVSGHVGLGRPFTAAVELVARDVDLGALDDDVHDLAFTLDLTTRSGDLRAEALDRFVDRVGTPLAEQTVGLVTGALDAGSDAEDLFETLQAEVARLYHQKKALRDAMLVYVAVGWTTALLVVGIAVAVNLHVLDSFAQLSAVSGPTTGMVETDAVDVARERHRFYLITQATMLACGWFAGTASRDRYDALLHSGALVVVAYAVFAGVGLT
jgi:archaellum biogenesis protein FlaJ (TadC family)